MFVDPGCADSHQWPALLVTVRRPRKPRGGWITGCRRAGRSRDERVPNRCARPARGASACGRPLPCPRTSIVHWRARATDRSSSLRSGMRAGRQRRPQEFGVDDSPLSTSQTAPRIRIPRNPLPETPRPDSPHPRQPAACSVRSPVARQGFCAAHVARAWLSQPVPRRWPESP